MKCSRPHWALAFSAVLLAIPAAADYMQSQRAVIENLATPLSEDLILYRWQSKISGDALLRAKIYGDDLHARFMSMSPESTTLQAGRGLYVSENPFSSSRYMNGDDEGSLIEVHIKKGTRFLDVNDAATDKRIAGAKLLTDEVLQLDAPVAIKYHSRNGWWVLKGQSGISFSAFDGARFTPEQLSEFYDKLATPKSKSVFTREVSSYVRQSLEHNVDPDRLTKLSRLMQPSDTASLRAHWERLEKEGSNAAMMSNPARCAPGDVLRLLENLAKP